MKKTIYIMDPRKNVKRKYDRVKDTVLLDVYKPGAFEEKSKACLTDIGMGGVGFESSSQFNKGDKIDLVFTLENGDEYVLEGVIIRVVRAAVTYSYGVEFVLTSFFTRVRLKKFLKSLLSKSE
ncbi:MAG: PilZ domain-containing protein [bacterium]